MLILLDDNPTNIASLVTVGLWQLTTNRCGRDGGRDDAEDPSAEFGAGHGCDGGGGCGRRRHSTGNLIDKNALEVSEATLPDHSVTVKQSEANAI